MSKNNFKKILFFGLIIIGFVFLANGIFNRLDYLQASANTNAVGLQTLPQTLPTSTLTTLENSNASIPKTLNIPSLKVTASFEALGLNPDHTLEVPKNPIDVGWYIYGAAPGQVGASIIVGHLDSAKGPAIFANLNKIRPGDKIIIERTDGTTATYQVDSLSQFSQGNFPTQTVYGAINYAGIRLITCSGVWSKKAGHYSNNLVVFGTLIVN